MPARAPVSMVRQAAKGVGGMRTIEYLRHEFHDSEPEQCKTLLPVFLCDVPYLIYRGVIPPLEILNAILKEGGSVGGMGPGATWSPFSIDEAEYEELIAALMTLDLGTIREQARFVPDRIKQDAELANRSDRLEWLKAVREKYSKDNA